MTYAEISNRYFELGISSDDEGFYVSVSYNTYELGELVQWRDRELMSRLEKAKYISERLEAVGGRGYELDPYSATLPFRYSFEPVRRIYDYVVSLFGRPVNMFDDEVNRYYKTMFMRVMMRYLGFYSSIIASFDILVEETDFNVDESESDRGRDLLIITRGRRKVVAEFGGPVLGIDGDVELFDEFERYLWLFSLMYTQRPLNRVYIVLDRLGRRSREELLKIVDVLTSLANEMHCVDAYNEYAFMLLSAGLGREVGGKACFYGVAMRSDDVYRSVFMPLVVDALAIIEEAYG